MEDVQLYDGPLVLEAGARLGLTGQEVYHLIFVGELEGGPGRDGRVHVTEAALASYRQQQDAGR